MPNDEGIRSLTTATHAGAWPVGGGEMGALMRSLDWSKTRLGPVELWPQSLRTMLGVVLGSRFPMLLWWGPDLLHLYNDAYRPILRDKHPEALAAPAAQVWAEVWDVACPLARSVQEGGPATWTEDLQLFIKSGEMAEETYFTFSYSPVPGDDGRIGGLLNTVQETTAKVQGERQIRMLRDLAARAGEARSEDEALQIAASVLSGNPLDLPFVLVYRSDDNLEVARLLAEGGLQDYRGTAKAAVVSLKDTEEQALWPLGEVVRSSVPTLVEDLTARFGPMPLSPGNARPERALMMPLTRIGQPTPYAILVAGISPHRVFDDRYQRCFRDIVDHVASAVAIARAYAQERLRAESLAEIDRAKTAFFSNVSHEFRTPLTLILGPIEDALNQTGSRLEGEPLSSVHRSALRLLRLVNNLLDFSRVEAGRLQSVFEATDLAALTRGLADSFRSLVETAGMALVVDCPALPEPAYVDRSHWEKIVLNLVSNAFKFTFQGSITVALRARDGVAELTVSDTGTGIPESELGRVFDRFHRVEGARGRSFEGTGIGLALVQELARQHDGAVRVTSAVDQGSTFTVTIPLGVDHLPRERIARERPLEPLRLASSYLLEAEHWQQPRRDPEQSDPIAPSLAPTQPREQKHRPRILVADDSADMREYICRLIAPYAEVEAAADGAEALERIRRCAPDLVLSDVMMPRMDGFALIRAIREDASTKTLPVVLLSAHAGEDAVLGGLESGADDYLVKPFSARELLVRLRTHLELAQMRRAAEVAANELALTRATLLADVERKNKELKAFSYSVSHDLRAPLRSISGFSQALFEDVSPQLDEQGRAHIDRIRNAAKRMSQLIDDILLLSRVDHAEVRVERVDLSEVARSVAVELRRQEPTRSVTLSVQDGLSTTADSRLVGVLFENLLGNAWKFTGQTSHARIEFGSMDRDGETVLFVRDNGAGFDMTHVDKLFNPFQRLHTEREFQGTGIGLATVHRIVERFGGRVWAEGAVGKGATIYFTIPGRSERPA